MFKTEQIIKKVHIMDLPRDGATVALQYVQPGGTGRDTASVISHRSQLHAERSQELCHLHVSERKVAADHAKLSQAKLS